MPTLGSLFSGIGGLELGFEWQGFETRWQVESNPFCRAVLRKHWPDAAQFDDVRTVGRHNLEPVDVIVGGFPCQDVSDAGKRVGIGGARSGLWSEFARIVRELDAECAVRGLRRPVVVVENVAGLFVRGFDTVLGDLAASGRDAEWACIRARDVGAPHLRRRVFIVAYPARGGLGELGAAAQPGRGGHAAVSDARVGAVADAGGDGCGERGAAHDDDGGDALGDVAARRGAGRKWDEDFGFLRMGDATTVGCDGRADDEGGGATGGDGAPTTGGERVADPAVERCERGERARREAGRGPELSSGLADPAIAGLEGRVAVLPRGGRRRLARPDRWPAGRGAEQFEWEPPRCLESSVGRRADGVSRRLARWRRAALEALGNAVVPQVAQVVAVKVREVLKDAAD